MSRESTIDSDPAGPEHLQRTVEQLRTEHESLRQELKQLRRQQQVLRNERSNLLEIQRIAGIADIVVYEVNAMSNRLRCPEGGAAVFGEFGRDASIEDLLRVIHPEDRERFERQYAEAINDGQPHNISHRIISPTGETRIVNHHIKTFMALNGWPLKTFGLIQDITERTQMELELKEALRRAEEATRAKSSFLANMSHEIRTPLSGVMGLAHLLHMTSLEPTQQDYVNGILASSDTLLALINEILDLGKIEAGKMELEHVEFSLDEILGDIEVLFRSLVGDKDVELRLERAAPVPSALSGDPLRLRQVLSNLVSNAVKFTERGHVAVAVDALETSEQEVTLRFAVTDTGIGIPAEKLGVLFESFTQADGSTARKYGGSGLGLAICRQLATLMQGQMGADSVEGQGSTFWATLRFTRVRRSENKAQPGPEGVAPAPVELGGVRTLLVEDNPVNRKIVSKMLSMMGLEVDQADDGFTALRMVEAGDYELVLMDIQMPDMDGYEAIDRIRANERLTPPPIIAMTAHAMAGDRQKCLRAGASDYISKPFNPRQLREVVLRVLERERR